MAAPIYKVLDCQRKGILGIPSGAVHLWLAYWMHESEDNESYISTRALAAITKMDRNTVMKWQRYLIANGWLKLAGGSAADKYDNPTRGASKVMTMRVDDPLKGCLAEKIGHEEGGGIIQPEGGGNLIGGKIQPKVYGSGSVYVSSSRCVTVPFTTPAVAIAMPSSGETFSIRSNDEGQNQEQHQEPNQNQKQNPLRSASGFKPQLKQSPKYDSPFPAEFDSWSVQARAEWVVLHSVKATVEVPVPVEKQEPLPVEPEPLKATPVVQPPKTPPPPKPPAPVPPATEIDWRLEGMKSWVQTIHQFQTYYNAKVTPTADWETAWLDGVDALYKLTEGKDAYFPKWFMFRDVMMLSHVRHATKYTTPASIAAHIPELAGEALALRTSGEFDTVVVDEFYRVSNLGKPKEEEPERTAEEIEKQQAEENESNAKRAAAWQKWIEQNKASICITA